MGADYYTPARLAAVIAAIENHDDIPRELCQALSILGENIELFPCEEDPARYTVEFIYPH